MATNSLQVVKHTLFSPAIQEQIQIRLGENAGAFTSSVLDLVGANSRLMECDPMLVIKEAMKAASLNLPVSNQLGFAYVIPYKIKGVMTPSFQMGYKGYIQLALRTGRYKYLNAGIIYEGQTWEEDQIAGVFSLNGEQVSDQAIGYFAYMRLLEGFEKGIAWTKEQVTAHAKRYSKEYQRTKGKYGVWKDDFDGMAKKTMLLRLIPPYGPMSIDIAKAQTFETESAFIASDLDGIDDAIDLQPEQPKKPAEETNTADIEPAELTEAEKQEILAAEARMKEQTENKAPF